MLNEISGDVWKLLDENSALCILTNNSIYNDKNPMGGGIAYEALLRNPGLDTTVAIRIKKNEMVLGYDTQTQAVLLRFPTKVEITDPFSSIELIKNSLTSLRLFCKMHSKYKVYLPKPGCGIGGLDWETQVKPLCEEIIGNFKNIYIVSK